VRLGRNYEVRPFGGGAGCLGMIVISALVSLLLTVFINLMI
jgi:hypothetical protein